MAIKTVIVIQISQNLQTVYFLILKYHFLHDEFSASQRTTVHSFDVLPQPIKHLRVYKTSRILRENHKGKVPIVQF